MTLYINGVQVDIQAAIVINSVTGTQLSFQHIYFARVAQNAEDDNSNHLCEPNPCQNGGTCLSTTNFTYICLCPTLWRGCFF